MNVHAGVVTRGADHVKAHSIYVSIEQALGKARTDDDTVVQAIDRVRDLMRIRFPDVAIVRKFDILDGLEFREWYVRVRYPDGREVGISHQS